MLKILRRDRARRLLFNFLLLNFLGFGNGFAQSLNQIHVVDENNQGLIGAYINISGQNYTTDNFGQFQFDFDIGKETLISVDYLGYETNTQSFGSIEQNNFIIQLKPALVSFEEVEIVGRLDVRSVDLPYKVTRIKQEEIKRLNAQSSADALMLSGQAFVQKSQMGGGSPILRGFEANKVLLVVDGVRMNNAIYRNGHLQNAITIDPNVLSQMELIFGAGSLLYGSEALGGVIHFRTLAPKHSINNKTNFSGGASARYNSANHEKTSHIHINIGRDKLASLTSISFSDFGDLRAGSNRSQNYPAFGLRPNYTSRINGIDTVLQNENPNIQIGTGYSQFDLLQKFAFKMNKWNTFDLNMQYSQSSDIPRYDNLIELRNEQLRYAEWYYGPQRRLLISPQWHHKKPTAIYDAFKLIFNYQKIDEDRISRTFGDPFQEHQEEDVTIFGFTLDFNKILNAHQDLRYGIDYHYNDVQSKAFSLIDFDTTSPTQVNNILSRYPSGGSQLYNGGLYIQHNWRFWDNKLQWINGLRYTSQHVSFNYRQSDVFNWPDYFYSGISNSSAALVGISGLNYQHENWLIKMSSGTSFRSPNVDDLAKVRVNNDEITIPNPELQSERVWNSEVTLKYTSKKLSLGATAYYTRISDAIVRDNFSLPNGNNIFITRNDTLNVTANVNSESGNIRGVSFDLVAKPMSKLTIASSINFQHGTAKNTEALKSPLAHIPPTFGKVQIKYAEENWQISLQNIFNGWKNIEDFGGSVDNPDLATPDGSLAWQIINLIGSWKFNDQLSTNLVLGNILDTHYRPFSSGVSGAGRHLSISLNYNWE